MPALIQYIDDFIHERYSWNFGVCPWGSCQYQSAYYAHKALSDDFKTVDDVLQSKFVQGTLGDKTNDFDRAFKRAVAERYPGEQEYHADQRVTYTPAKAMLFMKKSAWDLWSAAPFLLKVIYPSSTAHVNLLNEDCDYDSDSSDVQNGRYPITNFRTGFEVFLLEKAGHIAISDACNFDT